MSSRREQGQRLDETKAAWEEHVKHDPEKEGQFAEARKLAEEKGTSPGIDPKTGERAAVTMRLRPHITRVYWSNATSATKSITVMRLPGGLRSMAASMDGCGSRVLAIRSVKRSARPMAQWAPSRAAGRCQRGLPG